MHTGSREEIATSMYRATALLITSKSRHPLIIAMIIIIIFFSELDRTLLYSVCQLPVKDFKEISIAIGVDCWQWLISRRPDLEYRVKGRHMLVLGKGSLH